MRKAKIYLDTEFTDFYNSEFDIKLISIGLVSECGKECYVELTDYYQEYECSDFVIANILPQLDNKQYGLTPPAACQKIREFIESFGSDLEYRLCTDSPGYDLSLLIELFNEFNQPWPQNCNTREAKVYLNIEHKIYEFFRANPTLSSHHALNDARALRHAHQ